MNLLPIFEKRFDDNGKSLANYQRIRQVASGFLSELVKYGDDAFGFCAKDAANSDRRSHSVILALARHNLTHLDSISVLLGAGCVDGCSGLLRSILDATFGIAHIVQAKHEERALAYYLVRIKKHIKFLRRGDRSHPDGRQLESDLATDIFTPGVLSKLPSGLAEKAAELERKISEEPEFGPILAEWDRLRSRAGKKDPEWYALFGEGRDIRGLAKQLGWQSMYDFFYREWSNATHAGNVIENFATADNCVRCLRYPTGYAKVFGFAFGIYIQALEKTTSFFNHERGEQVRKYVLSTMNPEFNRISKQLGTLLTPLK